MLLRSQRSSLKRKTSILHKEVLDNNLTNPDSNKEPVGEDVVEDVELLASNLSAVELIEEVKPHEGVED